MTLEELQLIRETLDNCIELVKHDWGGPESAYDKENKALEILDREIESFPK